jgi:RimJ/RimL family protein N-acetyltransferase
MRYRCNRHRHGSANVRPAFETERLVPRGLQAKDFESFAAMWADPDVTRHLGDGVPRALEDPRTSFRRTAGFNERKRDRGEALAGIPEMGWMFCAGASGKGYATEAVRAALAWGKKHFGAVRIIAIVAPENLASMRVAEKCGFAEFHRGPSAGRARVFFDRIL